MRGRLLRSGGGSLIALAACQASGDPGPPSPSLTATLTAPAPPLPDPGFPVCPPDMMLVEGDFCPEAEQRCLEADPEHRADPSAPERCTRFAEPSTCRSTTRQRQRFCIDRYEWPNRKGDLPLVLVDFHQAEAHCESVHKRLCDEHEWLFACEGERMLPYTYGYIRDPTRCVIDRLYVERPRALARWDDCMASKDCRALFERLDQREPAGTFVSCTSPFGVHDMNGNVNEWVRIPGASSPRRSGLKGGWWGPVRNRCRPTVRFHDENDWGYEIGFRCCRDAAPEPG
jgi:formylglycine-generating enzyme